MDDDVDNLQCKVCGAHATGFHFDAQSCSACCAFFRRAISLKRIYKCDRGLPANSAENALCNIIYTERKLCRACRLKKCFIVGMNETCVQGPKSVGNKMRAYCTSSGLRRNKRFSVISNVNNTVWRKEYSTTLSASHSDSNITSVNGTKPLTAQPPAVTHNDELSTNPTVIAAAHGAVVAGKSATAPSSPAPKRIISPLPSLSARNSSSSLLLNNLMRHTPVPTETPPPIPTPTYPLNLPSTSAAPTDLLGILVVEEMRIAERRKILFCEQPVGSLLGNTKNGPFTLNDIKPLDFYEFRRSVRIHILLIYEWIRVFPYYEHLCKPDQLTLLRKSVLYHTILDPCFITLQVGDMSKFVMQNGGYVSTVETSDEGWHDENEISRDNKKKIYWPLLKRLMSDIITQMVALNLQFEEFVAIKALISIQMTICDASTAGRVLMKQAVRQICQSLHEHYDVGEDLDKAARLGNVLLLISPIFDTAMKFVESHHEVQFFDLWQIDSLLLQFLKNKV